MHKFIRNFRSNYSVSLQRGSAATAHVLSILHRIYQMSSVSVHAHTEYCDADKTQNIYTIKSAVHVRVRFQMALAERPESKNRNAIQNLNFSKEIRLASSILEEPFDRIALGYVSSFECPAKHRKKANLYAVCWDEEVARVFSVHLFGRRIWIHLELCSGVKSNIIYGYPHTKSSAEGTSLSNIVQMYVFA